MKNVPFSNLPSGGTPGGGGTPQKFDFASRTFIFWVELTYLILLLGLSIWYWQGSTLHAGPVRVNLYCFLPNPIGAVPLEIAWFGALGAVLVSFHGIFRNASGWNRSMWAWYVGRPWVGSALGVVAYFLLAVIIQTSQGTFRAPGESGVTQTVTPAPAAAAPETERGTLRCDRLTGPPSPGHPARPPARDYFFYAAAFIVGFREETFRRLIAKVADLILAPGESGPALPAVSVSIEPPSARNAVGMPHTVTATVRQAGSPKADAAVAFSVTGAHQQQQVVQTDANGKAVLTYTGTAEGTDAITCSVLPGGETEVQSVAVATATKTWTPASPES